MAFILNMAGKKDEWLVDFLIYLPQWLVGKKVHCHPWSKPSSDGELERWVAVATQGKQLKGQYPYLVVLHFLTCI